MVVVQAAPSFASSTHVPELFVVQPFEPPLHTAYSVPLPIAPQASPFFTSVNAVHAPLPPSASSQKSPAMLSHSGPVLVAVSHVSPSLAGAPQLPLVHDSVSKHGCVALHDSPSFDGFLHVPGGLVR